MAQTNGKKNGGKKTANLVSDGVVKMTAEIETPETPETVETPKAASRGHYAAAVVYSLTADQIAEAIADGRIANVGTTDVTISAKVTKTKDESITYEKLIALTADGQAFLCGGKMEPATDAPESGKDERTERAEGERRLRPLQLWLQPRSQAFTAFEVGRAYRRPGEGNREGRTGHAG